MISLLERNCLKVTDLGKHQELCFLYWIMWLHMVQERLCNLKINTYKMWNKIELYKSTTLIFQKEQQSVRMMLRKHFPVFLSKKWMKNKMSNYLSISINDATFDLNITLNTMVEWDPLRPYYCNLFEEY